MSMRVIKTRPVMISVIKMAVYAGETPFVCTRSLSDGAFALKVRLMNVSYR